jgi:hypothetical protein
MTSETILVAAAFEHPADAETAVKDLGSAGFGQGDISLMYTDKGHLVREGLVEGAAFGGLIGGLVGLLFPPVGIIVAAGPIVGSLASAIAGATSTAVAGAALLGLTNALIGIGMPREMATSFGAQVHKGDTLVVVHTTRERAEQVRSTLEAHKPRAETSDAAPSGAAVTPVQTPSAQTG